MLAAIRPDSWNLPLFLHVLGAAALFGGIAAVLVVGIAARRNTAGYAPLLARVSFWTLVLLALPAWILMRVGAQLIADKEFPGNTPNPDWLGVGYGVSEGGLALLIVLGILAFFSMRRGGTGRTAAAVPAVAGLYVVALAVAWFAMSGKPGG